MELLIDTSGQVRCLYDETVDLSSIGRLTIHRGSYVEPTEDGCWTADLAPALGPILGPFLNRSTALAAERDWLLENWLVPAG